MKYIFLLPALIIHMVAGAQTITFDLYGHQDYFNNKPDVIIIFNENWEDLIEYGDDIGDYHKKIEYDFTLEVLETTTYDHNGKKLDYTFHVMDVFYSELYGDDTTFLIYDPQDKEYHLFLVNDYGYPQLLVEDKFGVGKFHSHIDMVMTY